MKAFTKNIYAFSLLLSVILTTACSNDHDTLGEVPVVDILSRFNAEGKAYLTVQIPLGGGAGTRAVTFDDGDGDEWKVRNIYILIFAGTSESNAKFASAYKVESLSLSLSAFEQVTATATITINDANLNTGDKLFPFIVVNNNTSAITTSAFPATSVAFANGGSPVVLTSSSTFADLANVTIADIKDASGYFLMTNATLADANTTSGTVFHLPEMSASYFFPTQAQSQGNPAAHISVERLAAKTTVNNSITNNYILGNPYATFDPSSDMMFALDNYNTRSYAYRHLSAVSYQRFVETASIDGHSPLAYRTYWGEDVNYSGNSGLAYTSHATYLAYTDEQKTAFWHAMGSNAYCAENTFNVSNMQDDCTTSVLVRLQLNDGGDFYTTSVTGQDIIFQPPYNEVTEEGTSASSSFSRRRSGKVTYDGTDYATIDDYLRTWLMENSSAFRTWVSTYAAGDPRHVNIAVSTPAGGGTATVTAVTQTARSSGTTGATAFNTLETTGLAAYINNNVTLKFYDDGYCYYRVPIRHFTNTETPWQSTPAMTNNTTAQAYSAAAATAAGGSGADATFLGRYGMVRNNWYTINITSVTHVGYPTIPALTSNADDTIEQLLNATLSISGWEDKSQNLN